MAFPSIRTQRLFLRPLALSDAPALLPVLGDPETMRFWAYAEVGNLQEAETRLATNVAREGEPPNGFAIAESQEGQALGWVTLYSVQDGNAGIGYIISKTVRGRGYVPEAVGGFLNFAFGERALHRVYLDIDPENSASIRIAQKMGFRWEGHFKESFLREGVYYDSVYYAMLAREWRALKG